MYRLNLRLITSNWIILFFLSGCFFLIFFGFKPKEEINDFSKLKEGFLNPPDSCRPGVYWYFMDGNLSKEGITKDLQSMKDAGIGSVIFLEVNVGVPRGKVDFFSEKWQNLFAYAANECEALGIEMILGIGPGWTGSGGPWVNLNESMQHLTASIQYVSDTTSSPLRLALAPPRRPYFGEGNFTPSLKTQWQDYYKDITVLAFPLPDTSHHINDIDEKALYYRAPYSSLPGVKQYLPETNDFSEVPDPSSIKIDKIINLSDKLLSDGTLNWKVPKGNWVIMRFVARNNGAITRPAPLPGLGFEADKMDTSAINKHLEHYVGTLLSKINNNNKTPHAGLRRLHMDSWEMGAQNWTDNFRKEFITRRGYDPLPYYPVYLGFIVGNREISERFLWDLRQTSQELILQNHAEQVKKYAHNHNLLLSIEPYDMNPTSDLELGNIADIPMAEFWSRNKEDFNTSFSIIEATSIAHVNGISLIPAESFTANAPGAWHQYPGYMKEEGDWAFAAGINKFMYHTFQNQNLPDSLKPGMTMGPFGVQWNRNQTWWPMAKGYHTYIARCQYMLQQGKTVADILYLAPEGSPLVFNPPQSALDFSNKNKFPDRKGYSFDGCAPSQLYKAYVENNKITFPGGASYEVLVLPRFKTMTPALLNKIKSLVKDGATIIGGPPSESPGLSNYPASNKEVKSISADLWKTTIEPANQTEIKYGNGKIIWGGAMNAPKDELYPGYDAVADWLAAGNIPEDFHSTGKIRYTHRTLTDGDIYFIANKTDTTITENIRLRCVNGTPQLWNPMDGSTRDLPDYVTNDNITAIPITLQAHESYFIVFGDRKAISKQNTKAKNFSKQTFVQTLDGPWTVSFDPKWGGPQNTQFNNLTDWTTSSNPGIKYYSGIASYTKKFKMPEYQTTAHYILDLGDVKNIAGITLNGKNVGVVWTAPWQINISQYLKKGNNDLKIDVANLWINRLIGDAALQGDGPVNGTWPEWLIQGKKRPGKRYTFVTNEAFTKDSPLSPSGLLGPVNILKE